MEFPNKKQMSEAKILLKHAISVLACGCKEKLSQRQLTRAAEDLADGLVNDIQQGVFSQSDDDY